MSWLPMWSWFKRSGATNDDPEPKPNKNNRDRVYNNNSNTSSQTISKERDLISRTKINETKQLLSSIKDLATTLESLPLDDLLSKPVSAPLTHDTPAPHIEERAVPVTDLTSVAEETLSEDDERSDHVSQESETLTIGSDDSPLMDSDHSSQSSTSKSPGRGLVRGTGVSVSQSGDMIWDERRGWVSRSGQEDVLQVDLLHIAAPSTPLSADLPQDFVLHLNTERLAHEHAQLGAWMQSRDTDRSYLYLIRTMSIMKMVREVETVRRMMSDSDSDEDELRVRSRVNNSATQSTATSVSDKPSRVMSDKLKQFVDEHEEEDDIVLPDKPLKLVQQSANTAQETAFPSELTVELDSKTSNGHAAHSSQGQTASDIKAKTKRGKGLKLVPAQATFSDELVFDDEPKKSNAVSATTSGKKDLSAFVDEQEEQPIKPVKAKSSKMKLITLDSLQSASLPSRAKSAVQSVNNATTASEDKQDEELFDDIELPSGADLKRRFKALRPNTSAGTLVKRHSSGKIDNSALEDWCEDDDDDVPVNTNKSAVNNNKSTRSVTNLLTVQ